MNQKIGDLQQTIQELHKLGAFTEEELQLLSNLELTVDEVKDKVGGKFRVQILNHSTNPSPVLAGEKLQLLAYINEPIIIAPKGYANIPTGIEIIELPEHVNFLIESHSVMDGILSSHFSKSKRITLTLFNFREDAVKISNATPVGLLHFCSLLNEKFIEVNTIQNQ